nr:MAG TPA: hypothetical protein [Caudoviricetes sp.]
MTTTTNNTNRHESPTCRTTMKAGMVRWYLKQRRQMAEHLRRNHGREN